MHRIVPANAYRVPPPFHAFAVRSDEPRHAFDARAPYDKVHAVRTDFDPPSLARLAAEGYARVKIEAPGDIDYATTGLPELEALSPGLVDAIAVGLQMTRVLGPDLDAYRASLATRIDYLASRGAGFHNDVRGHWSRSLFWILALDAADVSFVMPHAGVQVEVAPADLLVFDQAMAHGLCRPGDRGEAIDTSFADPARDRQIFLTGELLLTDAQWAALGSPWLPVEEHRAALDLMVAEFDDRTGAVKRPRSLQDCMRRSTCHVDDPAS